MSILDQAARSGGNVTTATVALLGLTIGATLFCLWVLLRRWDLPA